MFFVDPLKIFIPLPGESDLGSYEVYRYDSNPAVGWQKAVVGDGWLEYREDHEASDPPTIEVWVNHFTGLLLSASDSSSDGFSGSSDGGSSSIDCFIATAAYGSPYEKDVVIFRQFRDRYLLTNSPGRLFVRTYYRLSPPLADFIAGHDTLRAMVRCALSPLATASDFALTSPKRAKEALLAAILLTGVMLVSAATTLRKVQRHRRI